MGVLFFVVHFYALNFHIVCVDLHLQTNQHFVV